MKLTSSDGDVVRRSFGEPEAFGVVFDRHFDDVRASVPSPSHPLLATARGRPGARSGHGHHEGGVALVVGEVEASAGSVAVVHGGERLPAPLLGRGGASARPDEGAHPRFGGGGWAQLPWVGTWRK